MHKHVTIMFVLTFFFFSALEATMPRVNPRPRAMAMGSAQIATNVSEDSVSYNPAALTQIEGFHLQVPLTVLIMPQAVDIIQNAKDLNDDNKSDSDKKPILQKLLSDYAEDGVASRLNLFPNVSFKHFQIGLDIDTNLNISFETNAGSNRVGRVDKTYFDAAAVFGTGWAFLEDALEVGGGAKFLYSPRFVTHDYVSVGAVARASNDKENHPGWEPQDEFINLSKRAPALGFDAGVRYHIQTLEKYGWAGHEKVDNVVTLLKPAVALTYQDIANTRYWTNTGMNDIEQSISLGIAVHPEWWHTKNTFAIDLRGLNQDEDFLLKLHLGAECLLYNFFAVRGGLEQGYLTGGVGFDLRFLRLDVFTTAYEVGKYTRQKEGRAIGLLISAGV